MPYDRDDRVQPPKLPPVDSVRKLPSRHVPARAPAVDDSEELLQVARHLGNCSERLSDNPAARELLVTTRNALRRHAEELSQLARLYDGAVSPAHAEPAPTPVNARIRVGHRPVDPDLTPRVPPLKAPPEMGAGSVVVKGRAGQTRTVQDASRSPRHWPWAALGTFGGLAACTALIVGWLGASGSDTSSPAVVHAKPAVAAAVPTTADVPPPAAVAASAPAAPAAANATATPLPHAYLSTIDISWGRTSVRRLRWAMKRTIGKMQRCLQQAPRAELDFPDRVTLAVRLNKNGRAMWARSLDNHGSRAAYDCLTRAAHATYFPKSVAGLRMNAQIVYTKNI